MSAEESAPKPARPLKRFRSGAVILSAPKKIKANTAFLQVCAGQAIRIVELSASNEDGTVWITGLVCAYEMPSDCTSFEDLKKPYAVNQFSFMIVHDDAVHEGLYNIECPMHVSVKQTVLEYMLKCHLAKDYVARNSLRNAAEGSVE
mgnify:FL=1